MRRHEEEDGNPCKLVTSFARYYSTLSHSLSCQVDTQSGAETESRDANLVIDTNQQQQQVLDILERSAKAYLAITQSSLKPHTHMHARAYTLSHPHTLFTGSLAQKQEGQRVHGCTVCV